MTNNSSPFDIASFQQQSTEARFDSAIALWHQQATLWALKGSEGMFLLETDTTTALPLWPDAALASYFADAQDISAEVVAVSLEQFRGLWLAGLMQDDIQILVAPLAMQGEDMLLSAEDLVNTIEEWQ